VEVGNGAKVGTLTDFLSMAGAVFDLLPDGLRVCDMVGRVQYANRAFYQMSGYSPADIMSRAIDDIYAEEDRPRIRAAFEMVKKVGGHGPGTIEVRLNRKGADPFVVSVRAVLIRNVSQEPIGALAMYRDVARIERIMSEPLDLLNLTGSPVEILRQLPARVSSYFPGRPWVMINLVEGEYLRFAYAVNVPAELMAQGGEPLAGSICGIPISTGAFLGIVDMTADDRTRQDPCVIQYGCRGYLGYPIFHFSGRVLGTICVLRSNLGGFGEYDHRILQMVSQRASMELDRMALESRLEQSETEIRDLVEKAPINMWRCGVEGRFLAISRHGKRDLGHAETAFIRESLFDLIHPDELGTFKSQVDLAVSSKESFSAPVRFRKRSGDYGHFFTTVRPVYDPSGRVKLLEGVTFEIPGED